MTMTDVSRIRAAAVLLAVAALAQAGPVLAQNAHAGHGAPAAPATTGQPVKSGAAKNAAAPGGGGMHSMQDMHQMHQRMMGMQGAAGLPAPAPTWSYIGRDNPEPHRDNRWEMVPGTMPGMAVAAANLSPEQRCQALLADPITLLDTETRDACAGTEIPAAGSLSPGLQTPAPASAGGHGKHH